MTEREDLSTLVTEREDQCILVTEREDQCILGAPIDINGCRTGVLKAVERLTTMSGAMEYIDAYPAFFLHRNYLSMPRLLLKLRSSPCYRLHSELTQFDETLRQAASTVSNVNFDWVATVNTPRRSRWSWPLLGSKYAIASLCILPPCHWSTCWSDSPRRF